ncbi:hypothetical protein ACFQY8_00545 [Alloscardovia venturai]|uniref:Uncharacterized protein n=1 Tax=Alloscardovia venturai TaxID=1769421 RepID=A0ABW2Y391_9BIFI
MHVHTSHTAPSFASSTSSFISFFASFATSVRTLLRSIFPHPLSGNKSLRKRYAIAIVAIVAAVAFTIGLTVTNSTLRTQIEQLRSANTSATKRTKFRAAALQTAKGSGKYGDVNDLVLQSVVGIDSLPNSRFDSDGWI